MNHSQLVQPYLLDGIDHSYLTWTEWRLLFQLGQQHEQRVQQRARELKFSPDRGLTDHERLATLKCMTHQELTPLVKCGVLYTKMERMMTELSYEEQVDCKLYNTITFHFSKYGPAFSQLDDENIFIWTERYFRIMARHQLPVFEQPYNFLSNEEKTRVVVAGSQLDRTEYMTNQEIAEMERGANATILSHGGQ